MADEDAPDWLPGDGEVGDDPEPVDTPESRERAAAIAENADHVQLIWVDEDFHGDEGYGTFAIGDIETLHQVNMNFALEAIMHHSSPVGVIPPDGLLDKLGIDGGPDDDPDDRGIQ